MTVWSRMYLLTTRSTFSAGCVTLLSAFNTNLTRNKSERDQ